MRRCLGPLLACLIGLNATAQQEPHWEDLVIFGAGYMGPNALPVPWMNTGRTDNQSWIHASGVSHLSAGEQTYSLNTRANLSLVPNLLSFDLYWVPVEYFRMSQEVFDQRVVLPSAGDQTMAIGDVYLNSMVQLVDRPRFSTSIRVGFKFPSSDGVALSRFTDGPGYNLDAGFAIMLKETRNASTHLSVMAGFYSYQTQGGFANYRQNDAFLFGLALDYNHQNWSWRNIIRGYLGYFDLRDQPIVVRSEFTRTFGRIELLTACQVGIHDLYYVAPEVGLRFLLPDLYLGARL